LNRLVRELNLAQNPYAKRFQPIALQWYHIILNYQAQLIQAHEFNSEIDNPYIVGLPLSEEQQEIFVGRQELIRRIQQFLRDGRTALLLYGQRRMGKTSLLQNLGRFLPSTIVPLFVDEQGTAFGNSYADHLYSLARQMAKSAQKHRGLDFPPLAQETLAASPFIAFTDWLDTLEGILEAQGKSLFLLMLDEIEVLKLMVDKERFDAEDLLNLFRNLIQHRPKFKVLVAGSHTLEELQQWASYLINMEVIKINWLSTEETLRLIERPVPNFNLRYHPEASQRIVKLTRGHPYLTQLLCHEIVIDKNRQPAEQRNWVFPQDVEEAIPNALNVGNLFFANIQKNQADEQGVALLRFLATQGEAARVPRALLAQCCAGNIEKTLTRLQRRDLIEEVEGCYQFSIELIRRWFAQ
jgi:ATPase domain predominantly from Archaea